MYIPARRARNNQTLGGLGAVGDTPTLARVQQIGNGADGTIQTLKAMRDYARQSITDPAQTVRLLVLSLYAQIPERDWQGEVAAIHAFVRDRIRYTLDPDEGELVQTPQKTLEYAQGDCDDKATLTAAMLKAGGHPARFVAVGVDGGPFSHVFTESKIGDDWVPCETILAVPLGWFPPNITKSYIMVV